MKMVAKKCVFIILRFIIRPFWGKNVWLVADRSFVAGDNGQAFFEYLQGKPVKSYFIISKKSSDYSTMKKIGKVLNYDSLLQKMAICACDVYVCSHLDRMKDHVEIKSYFLQHGIVYLDLHTYFNPAMHEGVFISASSSREKAALTKKPYNISENQVFLTGMARYDKLYYDEKKKIVLAPTWKKSLAHISEEEFMKTPFFQSIQEITSDKLFMSELSAKGYTFHIKLHPLMKEHEKCFKGMNLADDEYVKLFAEANLFITDYSSVAFDMAYMLKPIIYYQPKIDKKELSGSNYPEDYFNMEQDGFGEIVSSAELLKKTILEYVSTDCKMKPLYEKRVRAFFDYIDRNNCQRIYESILAILGK